MGCKAWLHTALSFVFEYDTPMMVTINSKKVGILNLLAQITIIGYVIGYAIIYDKGYQVTGPLISSATVKLKGVVFTNVTTRPEIGARLWDSQDYIVPPQETDAFFITTNVVITNNQTQGKCPADPGYKDSWCNTDDDCPPLVPIKFGNGVRTGKCVESILPPIRKVCEIYAWCPLENDTLASHDGPLINPENFTVLIKNSVMFPRFNVKRRNIFMNNKTYLHTCMFDPVKDKYCPIFNIGKIVKLAGQDMSAIGYKGGKIAIIISWECDLDRGEENCKPDYHFHRLDKKNEPISRGWNFRYANHYTENGVQKRDMVKAYGIRFLIMVKGQAGKFNIYPLLLNVGSGLGLLAIASVLCDIFALYCIKKGAHFREKKYLNVEGDDAYVGPPGLKPSDENVTSYDSMGSTGTEPEK